MTIPLFADSMKAGAYGAKMSIITTEALEAIETPLLLVQNGRVKLANAGALSLLGRHSFGQDIRLAIRNPDALDLIASAEGGRITISGISIPGSNWELVCTVLSDGTRLITLYDLSASGSVSQSHTDFVANASHELRTPLAAVLGYVETLEDDKAGGDAITRGRFLAIIRREAERMQSLLDDLMSLSRIEASRHDAPNETLDLCKLAREVAGEFGRTAGITIHCSGDPVFASGDRGQLAQVVRNLLDNARKYGVSNGSITVSIGKSDNGWSAVQVHNEGEVIAAEHLPRLTERFYRADPGRSRAVGGTGLGLSIVKHIIVRHRGRFDIASKVGEGTTASFTLPPIRD
jgi:two-component system, OmpR family, phosphate regulon sensor histidine kinase PhoR